MKRRQLLIAAPAAPLLLTGCEGELPRGFASWQQARETVFELMFRPQRLENAWTLPQMLQHAAQSIEFSIAGFPELRSPLFRKTVGPAAFALFDARGTMNHDLGEPIPGAPALDAQQSLKTAVQRLLDAMQAFSAHAGEFQPHFAYGTLSRAEYQRAHLMHLANHWTQLQPLTATA